MNLKIKDYSNYELTENNEIINLTTKKIITKSIDKYGREYVKLKNDNGKWVSTSFEAIVKRTKIIKIPDGFVQIPWAKDYYINTDGVILSCHIIKNGQPLKVKPRTVESRKYPMVNLGKDNYCFMHILMARVFLGLPENHGELKLVVMHLDNNKNNYKLSNLKIGTYSENNKQAYEDGINSCFGRWKDNTKNIK